MGESTRPPFAPSQFVDGWKRVPSGQEGDRTDDEGVYCPGAGVAGQTGNGQSDDIEDQDSTPRGQEDTRADETGDIDEFDTTDQTDERQSSTTEEETEATPSAPATEDN